MLWVCKGCTAQYAESLESCPQCGSTERRANHEEDQGEEEGDVPKITVAAGPSNHFAEDTEGGEDVSPGTSSSTSSSTGPKSSSSTPPGPRSRARGAESPSSTPPAAKQESPTNSGAGSTAGGTRGTTSGQSRSDLKSKLLD